MLGTPLSSLMNIKAVGSDLEVDNSYCGAESGSIPSFDGFTGNPVIKFRITN